MAHMKLGASLRSTCKDIRKVPFSLSLSHHWESQPPRYVAATAGQGLCLELLFEQGLQLYTHKQVPAS